METPNEVGGQEVDQDVQRDAWVHEDVHGIQAGGRPPTEVAVAHDPPDDGRDEGDWPPSTTASSCQLLSWPDLFT